MIYEIRRFLRGAFLALAITAAAAMLSATPSQAIPSDGGCATTESHDDNDSYECTYCEILDSGTCGFICDNGTFGSFPCSEFG